MAGLTASSTSFSLLANKFLNIASYNHKRRMLIICNNASAPLSLSFVYGETDRINSVFAIIPPRTSYQLPITPDGSICINPIFAIASVAGRISCTEFVDFEEAPTSAG